MITIERVDEWRIKLLPSDDQQICYKACRLCSITILKDVIRIHTGVSHLPAWPFGLKKKQDIFVNIFRTVH